MAFSTDAFALTSSGLLLGCSRLETSLIEVAHGVQDKTAARIWTSDFFCWATSHGVNRGGEDAKLTGMGGIVQLFHHWNLFGVHGWLSTALLLTLPMPITPTYLHTFA